MTGGPLQDNVGAPHLNGPPPNSRSGPRFPCAILHLFHTCSSLLELFLFQDRVCFLHIPSHKTAPFHPSAVLPDLSGNALSSASKPVSTSESSFPPLLGSGADPSEARALHSPPPAIPCCGSPAGGRQALPTVTAGPQTATEAGCRAGGTGSRPCVLKLAVPLLVPAEHASLVPHQMWFEATHPVSSSTGGSGVLTDFL